VFLSLNKKGARYGKRQKHLETDNASIPPLGSGGLPLIAAIAAAATALALMRAGSGHTPVSRHFASRPEFVAWTWILAAEAAAAAAAATTMWPVTSILWRAATRRSIVWALLAWLIVGLAVVFGPKPLTGPGHLRLWLLADRLLVINVAVYCLITPCTVGMMLVQPRLAELRAYAPALVDEKRAGSAVVELLWLRTALQWLLITFAVIITGSVLAAGAGRRALLAGGAPTGRYPPIEILIYGGVSTMIIALIFIPAYTAWQQQAVDTRDRLYPVPENGIPTTDWRQARSEFDTILPARRSAASVLAAAFVILTPFAGSLVTTLITGH
jgi:hypothetical protein